MSKRKQAPDQHGQPGLQSPDAGESSAFQHPHSTEEISPYGRAIRHLRGKRNQREVAAAAGLDPTTWSFYETGRRQPKAENFQRLLRGLGCTELEFEETVWSFRRERLLGAESVARHAGDPRFVRTARQTAERLRDEQEKLEEGDVGDPLRQDVRGVLSDLGLLVEELILRIVEEVKEGRGAGGSGPGGEAA